MSDPIDLKAILNEYTFLEDDFGFSAVSEDEYNQVISQSEQSVEAYKAKLKEVEKLIIPFLMKLLSTADKEYIYWPNRKLVIEKQIQKIVGLTRS